MDAKAIHGIVVPISTPIDSRQRYDPDGMIRLIEHQIDAGTHGIFFLGTCGEGPCFSSEEAKEIIDDVVNLVDGRTTVYAGVGRNSTSETCELAAHAGISGADYAVVMPPHFFMNLDDKSLIKHYTTVAQEGLPVVLYAHSCANPLSTSVVQALGSAGIAAGMKIGIADPELEYFSQVVDAIPILQGDDAKIHESMKLGAVGSVPGAANVDPYLFSRLYAAAEIGDDETALRLQEKVKELLTIVYERPESAIAALKHSLSYLGLCSGRMRAPNRGVSTAEASDIENSLDDYFHCQ